MVKIFLLIGAIVWLVYSPAYASPISLLVGKLFLDVDPTDAQTPVSIDGGAFLVERVIRADLKEGAHTLLVQIPQGAKLFYALCSAGPFVDAGVGPALVKVSFEVKGSCTVKLVFTTPQMTYGVRIIE